MNSKIKLKTTKKIIKFLFLTGFLLFSQNLIAQDFTAKSISDAAIKKRNPTEAIAYINSQITKVTNPAEKRSLYAFLGSLQEMTSMYSEAKNSYAKAAGIAAGDAEGMQKKSSERLVIDAVRCALSCGEAETALAYLNSSVRNSKNTEIQAQIKLYEQWAALSIAENLEQAQEAISLLKVYAGLDSMKSVRQSILLTLWYITKQNEYGEILKTDYPESTETAIVNGKAFIMPSPFWYFIPR